MNKFVLAICLITTSFIAIPAQTKTIRITPTQPKERVSQAKNPAEKELEDLEHKLSDALVSKDEMIINKLLADDFTMAGSTITKKSYVEILKTPQLKFYFVEKSDMRIKIYGDAAVITGRNNTNRSIENGESFSTFNFMNVWVKSKSGEWQCTAMSQDSILLIFSY